MPKHHGPVGPRGQKAQDRLSAAEKQKQKKKDPTPDDLVRLLHLAFDYTMDNNPDLVGDVTFPMEATAEELELQHYYQWIIAYIHRNHDMVAGQLTEI